MHDRRTRASSKPMASGEKSASTLTTLPGFTPLSSKSESQREIASQSQA